MLENEVLPSIVALTLDCTTLQNKGFKIEVSNYIDDLKNEGHENKLDKIRFKFVNFQDRSKLDTISN